MNDTKTVELDALAGRWERRIEHLENRVCRTGCDEDQARGIQECVDDLRAYLESASPERQSAGNLAVSSSAWLDARSEIVASAASLMQMSETQGDCALWKACHAHYNRLIELCRQDERASNEPRSATASQPEE